MLDTIIRGGRVVTPEGVGELDVGIQGERIAALALPGSLEVGAGRTIDATGKIVLPGGIEPHAHIGIPVPEVWARPPRRVHAAARGGQPCRRIRGSYHPGRLRRRPPHRPRPDPVPGAHHAPD